MKIDFNKIKKEKPTEELLNFSILNIDKPANWTSFDVVNHIRKMLGLNKCGHFGTLDPNVTGVLPVCLENACRIQEYFMHHEKIYTGEMKLHKPLEKEKLESEMKKFIGKINQLPPRKSRVKRQLRQREIVKFELVNFNEKERTAEFIACVEAGTYIRKLVDDLGKNLGIGAHMTKLIRTRAGIFSDKDKEFTTIENLEKAVSEYKEGNEENLRALLIPAEIIAEILPSVQIKQEYEKKLLNGSPIFEEMFVDERDAEKIRKEKGYYCVFIETKLIEIAKYSEQFENKSILAKPENVLK